MTRPATGTLLRGSVPALGGLALGGILQAADPRLRLYVAGSPALVAVLAGLAGTAIVIVARRRAAAASAASAAAVRRVAEEALQDRLRFFMRLDHELKNPLTAIRAGLANIEQGGGLALASAGTVAAVASVSVQADRIARLVSDLRKLADLETRDIETAPVDLTALLDEPGGAQPARDRHRAGAGAGHRGPARRPGRDPQPGRPGHRGRHPAPGTGPCQDCAGCRGLATRPGYARYGRGLAWHLCGLTPHGDETNRGSQ
jgi:His Kinase A (phospho-acceptor) domain